jgi:hypothetical protein
MSRRRVAQHRSRSVRVAALALVALAVLATTARAGTTTYAGSSSQNDPFVLRFSAARHLLLFAFDFQAKCSSGTTFDDAPPARGARGNAPRLTKTGKFSGSSSYTDSAGDDEAFRERNTFTGVVRGTSASGTFRSRIALTNIRTGAKVDACDTGTLRWRTAPHQEQVYGGLTSRGEPVVLQADAKRTKVELVRIGWSADCADGTFVDFGEAFTDFRLSRLGGFGDSFTIDYRPEPSTGNHDRIVYALHGKLGASKAFGTFAALDSYLEPSGAVITTCKLSTLGWSALQ